MRTRLGVLVLALFLSGCGEAEADAEAPSAPAQTGRPWYDETAPAAAAGPVTGCTLPVRFDLADRWKPKPVTLDGSVFDDLAKQGGATMACEIDAKPAGNIGFLRVFTVDEKTAAPKAALEAFVAGDKNLTEVTYRDRKAGELSAVEVTYLRSDEFSDGKRERAAAVATAQGTIVLKVSGLDSGEFREMLPAYNLALTSMAAT
ncbi:MAG: lipoprotein [Actinoplanes sp.]